MIERREEKLKLRTMSALAMKAYHLVQRESIICWVCNQPGGSVPR